MEVEINWLAVVLATLSTMAVGSIWYMPSVFGNTWMKLIGKSSKDLEKNGMRPIFITVVVSFVTAFVLAHMTFLASSFYGADYTFLQTSLITAFWLWLGLVAARTITHDAFEGRPTKLTAINVSHELVTLLVMALIIGTMQP